MGRGKAKQPPLAADDASLEVLLPDRRLTVGERELIVRELRFEEQLRHNHLLVPIATALAALSQQTLEGAESINAVYDVLAANADALGELMALSCGQSQEWIAQLPPADGEALLLTWWTANSGFFVRRLWRPRLIELAAGQVGNAPAGEGSLLI